MVVIGVTPVKAQEKRTMTVSELFSLIESNNKRLQVEKTDFEVASKGLEAAKSQRLPDVNSSLSVSYNGNVLVTDRDFSNAQGYSSPHLGNSFALEASQVVYAGGAVDAGVRLAELQRQQASASQQQTREQLRFMALGQYLDLYKLGNRQQVLLQNIALTSRLIDDIKARHSEGMALRNDVTRYELQMENLRLQLRKVEDQQTVLNYQLCNTTGLAEGTTIVPDTTLLPDFEQGLPAGTPSHPALLAPSLPSLQRDAHANSPVLQQAQIGRKMSQQSLRLAKSELLPKVALVAGDNLNGPYIYDIPVKDINVNNWYVGVGIKYPISALFKKNKAVQQARIATRQSEERQQAAQEQIDNEVQQAWTLYQQAFAELAAQRKSVQLARQNYQVVSDRYLSQLALITDMLDASNIKLNAELQEVDARINIAYNYYKIKYITGTL